MRRLLVGILIVCLLFCTYSITVQASNNEEVVVVGYQPNLELVEDIDSMYHKGYGYEVLKKVEEISNLKFEFKEVQGDVFEALRTGEVDISGLFFRTDERREEFLYLDTPFSEQHMSLVVKEEDVPASEINYADNEYMQGKTVATYDGNPANELLSKYHEENGMSAPLFMIGDFGSYLEQDADLYLTYSGNTENDEFNTLLNLETYYTYIISTYENADIMEQINDLILTIVRTEGNFFAELEAKYNSDKINLNHRTITKEEQELLKSRTLKVGYLEFYAPMTYTNDEGVPSGALVRSLMLLAENYNIDLEFESYRLEDQESAHEKFDIVITMYGENEYMFEHFSQTESFLDVDMAAHISPELYKETQSIVDSFHKAKKVGILEYLFVNYEALDERIENGDVVLYPNIDVMLDDYKNGTIDIAIFTESASVYAMNYVGDNNQTPTRIELVIPVPFLFSNEIAADYVPIFNVMIDNVSPIEFDNLLLNESSLFLPSIEVSLIDELVKYWYVIVIIVLLSIGVLAYIYIKQERKKNAQIQKAYNTDALTDLPSFANFREMADKILIEAQPNEYEIISFDIDLFKSINSYYSMRTGTDVLIVIANALKEVFEGSPAVVCRRMGDQFVILRKIGERGEIKGIYSRYILPEIRKVIGKNYNVSMSFGIIAIEDTKQKVSEIISYADEARICGKGEHSTTFIDFTPKMLKEYKNKINVTFRMEKALADREFVAFYQPKIDFKTHEVGGAEALVRWFPKTGEMIYPGDFIEVFEKNGFIKHLDMYMFEEVCKFIKQNKKDMKVPIISTNLSAITVLDDKTIDTMLTLLSKYYLTTKEIELEVTESAIIGAEDQFLDQVKRLKIAGFIVSIDDFGAGVSSLNRLSAIEADVIKLDKAFFDLKDQGGRSNIVVEDVVTMAKHLDMKIVAEGVETYAQALWLQGLGCDLAQGYYFARPMEEEKFKEVLIKDKIFDIKNVSNLMD